MEQTQKKLRPADSAVERLGRRLIWTLTKKEASVLLNRIESFKSLLQIALANDLIAIKSDTAQIAGLTSNVDKMTQDIQDINLAEQPQLIRLQESIPPELQTLIQRKEREGTRTKVGEIVPILVSELKKYSRAFVVIDALDEFNPSNHSLEPLLWSLQKVSSIMVTSRYSRLVKGAAMFLDIVAPPADIERYVDAQFSTLPPSVSGKPDLRTTVVSGITALADGM
ncbi:hypothetical protein LTR28_004285 [Elasticomyces elasticus]|nr:hypothetical protein LTR28_004285 [Elasticomyces elasticus]